MINFRPSNFIEKDSEESKFFVINNDSLLSFSIKLTGLKFIIILIPCF